MNLRNQLIGELREIAADMVIQERPYPVIAPRDIDATARALHAARRNQFNVLPLGSGSSFPSDFSMLRQNVMALLTVRLTGLGSVTQFVISVWAGTPMASLLHGAEVSRRTVGGLLADGVRPENAAALCVLWQRVRSVEVMTSSGEIRQLPACGGTAGEPPAASIIRGSRGRMGLITRIELAVPVPVVVESHEEDRTASFNSRGGESILSSRDVQLVLDDTGLFQW